MLFTNSYMVNEGQPFTITTRFYDRLGIKTIPTTIAWEIHDDATGNELGAGTATPAALVDINIPGSVQKIISLSSKYELHIFTILIDNGLAGEMAEEVGFYVQNLRFHAV